MFQWLTRSGPRKGCRIDDIAAARNGAERFLAPTIANMRASLQRYGVIVIRDALDRRAISGLIENAVAHGARVEAVARAPDGNFEESFGPAYRFNKNSLACDVAALDQATKGRSDDFRETSLWSVILASVIRPILIETVGADASVANARARVVIPALEYGKNGQLSLHLEKLSFAYEGLHNIWTPLVPAGVRTNVDTPGLQFYIGRLEFFSRLSPETTKEITDFVATLGPGVFQEQPKADDEGFFFRPVLQAGDIAFFSGIVPHAGFVPAHAQQTRVGFDVRIFPKFEGKGVLPVHLAQAA